MQFQNTQPNKDTVVDALRTSVVNISFTKKDGTNRLINATLDPNLVTFEEKKTDRTKTPNPNVQPVYDIEAQGWRSFNWDSVQEVSVAL